MEKMISLPPGWFSRISSDTTSFFPSRTTQWPVPATAASCCTGGGIMAGFNTLYSNPPWIARSL
eukprot:CAMPEP_0179252820 /NCGR_PEP_ID=MMETSP0797-20121207/22409_1 /TAXON_ID=47934 /ORGANISM="Dinophysis acuminata, Strain DAEP01" /LENGTH=63 /DNA_ID=CAMNT_0020960657 /DNA_START=66 /DNA_END=254 /DNA_ORIENTATION=+